MQVKKNLSFLLSVSFTMLKSTVFQHTYRYIVQNPDEYLDIDQTISRYILIHNTEVYFFFLLEN
jgi:hypothetical protein